MKLLCEVALEVANFASSHFSWLKSDQSHFLFALEDARRLRIFNINRQSEPGESRKLSSRTSAQEVQSAALAEPRRCTSLCWNYDESLLALVVDRRQVYFWEVKRNNFVQFKPKFMQQQQQQQQQQQVQNSPGIKLDLKRASKEIEHIIWSRLSNKLAIFYASGQILFARLAGPEVGADYPTVWEKFIDNSEAILKRPASVVAAECADLFACTSVGAELLVMSFEGETKLYCQSENESLPLVAMSFSPPIREYSARLGGYREQSLWLAYQTSNTDDGLFVCRVQASQQQQQHTSSRQQLIESLQDHRLDSTTTSSSSSNSPLATRFALIVQQDSSAHQQQQQQSLVYFRWLTSNRLLVCLSTGAIHLVQLGGGISGGSPVVEIGANSTALVSCEVFRIATQTSDELSGTTQVFKSFELIRKTPGEPSDSRPRFALAAATSTKLFYYELQLHSSTELNFEHLDDVDLGASLSRLAAAATATPTGQPQSLERLQWSRDCSMLSVQLTSGHLLVYRTKLTNYLVASHGPRTAFVSSPHEVTLLNYGHQGDDAPLILQTNFEPSLLAVGPAHLALVLNNRVRFYASAAMLEGSQSKHEYHEQEYVTIVTGVCLSARFVAVLLDDGRLKLHSLTSDDTYENAEYDSCTSSVDDLANDERFFPDLTTNEHERISAFTLTEQLLAYCTQKSQQIQLFSLDSWKIVQVCDHSQVFAGPVRKLKANERGNKFVCLTEPTASSSRSYLNDHHDDDDDGAHDENVFLYDLYANVIVPVATASAESHRFLDRIFAKQLDEMLEQLSEPNDRTLCRELLSTIPAPGVRKTTNIEDAIWDTDGRGLLLIETSAIQVLAVLDHTLERETPIVRRAASLAKPATCTTLYVSQGIVSQQTSLGRVINSILETHDDELKLTKLEFQIKSIGGEIEEELTSENEQQRRRRHFEAESKVVALKLEYLHSILPIYHLSKCHDICQHLVEDEAFRLQVSAAGAQNDQHSRLLNSILWRHLAVWSIYLLNLPMALEIYKKCPELESEPAERLSELLRSIKLEGLNASQLVRSRVGQLLGLEWRTNTIARPHGDY